MRGKLLLIAFLLSTGACNKGNGKANTGLEAQEVPECVQYQQLISDCMHRDTQFASQPSLIPKTDEERDQIRKLCSENLERLRATCR